MKDSLKTLGASNHSEETRAEDDYYATPEAAVKELWDNVIFETPIYDPCVGGGHINNFFEKKGIITYGSDIADRGWPNTKILDFISSPKDDIMDILPPRFSIITNPPYKKQSAIDFIEKGMEILPPAGKMAMFLPLRFLESQIRYKRIFSTMPPAEILVFVDRIGCYKNGIPDNTRSAVCYCWFIWKKGFKGNPTIRWVYHKERK